MGPMGKLAAIPGDVAYGGELGNGGIMVDSAARRAERRVMELLDPGESDRITGQPGVAGQATVPATCCVDRGRWDECSVDDACSVHDVDSLPYDGTSWRDGEGRLDRLSVERGHGVVPSDVVAAKNNSAIALS